MGTIHNYLVSFIDCLNLILQTYYIICHIILSSIIINKKIKMIIETDLKVHELNQDINLQRFFKNLKEDQNNQQNGEDDPKTNQRNIEFHNKDWSSVSDYDFKDQVYSERPIRKSSKNKNIKRKQVIKIKKKQKADRTKIYISMLEGKVKKLEKEVNRLKGINQANLQYIKKISLSEQIINGFFVGRNQIFDRLETLSAQPACQETRQQILKEMDTLRYRLGVHGKDRIKAMDYYFNQIVQCFHPDVQKFLIYAACKNMDCFDKNFLSTGKKQTIKLGSENQWRLQILQTMNLDESKRKLVASYHSTIISQKSKFDQLMMDFCKTKKALSAQAKNIQNIYDHFREFLNPFQLAKILVNIQKNRFRKEMSLESFWTYVGLQEQVQPETKPFWTQYDSWAWSS